VAERVELARRLAETERDLGEAARSHAGERRRLEDERDRLYAELGAFRRRVEAMEATRAWRMREWLLGLRRRSRA
jgi:DNA repair exonuclease SbcCD ATPase subunit